MNHTAINPFDSIESAHEFVTLLAETAKQSKLDIEVDVKREANANFPRRLQALRLIFYNLEKLELHISKSRRVLNDLRSLRRLLLEERKAGAAPSQPPPTAVVKTGKAIATPKPEVASTAVVSSSVARVSRTTPTTSTGVAA